MFQCCHPHGTQKTSYVYVVLFKSINGNTHFIHARPNSIMGNPVKISKGGPYPEGFKNFL